jgi:hypothetical protein
MTVRDLIANGAVAMSIVRAPSLAAGIIAPPFLMRRRASARPMAFCGCIVAFAPNSNDQT